MAGYNRYAYKKLSNNGTHIRLLKLLPGTEEDGILCELFQVKLEKVDKRYTALSYTWGSSENPREIMVNGRLFHARSNLHDALCALRLPHDSVMLWIDAICINQKSIVERNQQVGLMGQIFSRAIRVDAWLDISRMRLRIPHDVDLQKIARFAQETRENRRLSDDPMLRTVRTFIEDIDRNIYWSRSWIVQELLLAAQIRFVTSAGTLSWDDVLTLVSFGKKEATTRIRAIAAVQNKQSPGKLSFEDLFSRFGNLDCEVEVDKFFSLYGLFSENTERIEVDYNQCILQILRQHVRLPPESPFSGGSITFLATFLRYFPRFAEHGECRHRRSRVKLTLPWRGSIKAGRVDGKLSVFREGDIYQHRWFLPEAPRIKTGDIAFDLIPSVHVIIVRRVNDVTESVLQSKEPVVVTSLINHGDWGASYCKDLPDGLENMRFRGYLQLPISDPVSGSGVQQEERCSEDDLRPPSLVLEMSLALLIRLVTRLNQGVGTSRWLEEAETLKRSSEGTPYLVRLRESHARRSP